MHYYSLRHRLVVSFLLLGELLLRHLVADLGHVLLQLRASQRSVDVVSLPLLGQDGVVLLLQIEPVGGT